MVEQTGFFTVITGQSEAHSHHLLSEKLNVHSIALFNPQRQDIS